MYMHMTTLTDNAAVCTVLTVTMATRAWARLPSQNYDPVVRA